MARTMREKIERRYANALGATELSKNSVEGRMLEVEMSTIDMAGSARLDQLRAQLHPELADAAKPAITGGDTAAAAAPATEPTAAPTAAPTEQA